jgi:hypothetical protein
MGKNQKSYHLRRSKWPKISNGFRIWQISAMENSWNHTWSPYEKKPGPPTIKWISQAIFS